MTPILQVQFFVFLIFLFTCGTSADGDKNGVGASFNDINLYIINF